MRLAAPRSPRICTALANGLPDPPSFKVLAPLGTVPFDPGNSDQLGGAFETTEDVEWAHAMAPDAGIVLLTSPVDATEGVQGLPQLLFLEKYALKFHLGNIISQSWGTAENTLFTPAGRQLLVEIELFYRDAAHAEAGDTRTANIMTNGTTFYKFSTVIFPASSPFVTVATTVSTEYLATVQLSDGISPPGGGPPSTAYRRRPAISANSSGNWLGNRYASWTPAPPGACGAPQRRLGALQRHHHGPCRLCSVGSARSATAALS